MLLFVVLTLIATYPIAKAPAAYTYFDHPDTQLNMWIMAWDAHALGRAPSTLFNANIFHPDRRTLAYSETLLGYLPIFGPILWLRGSPALAFNAVLLFSFVASGVGMYLLGRHLTGRHWPGIVAGIVYTFVPYRFAHVPQIQLEAMEWMPLAFLSLHLFVERGKLKYAIGLCACLVLQTLCCVYYGVFLMLAVLLGGLVFCVLDRRARQPRTLLTLALAGCLAAVFLAPLIGEYLRVHRQAGLERPIQEITEKSADAFTYLSSVAPLHLAWSAVRPGVQSRDYLFPGIVALALALLGLVAARRARLAAIYLAVAVVGFWASFGPNGLSGLSIYRPLYSLVPAFHGLRQVSRFGVLTIFGVSVLAAFGCASIEAALNSRVAEASTRGTWKVAVAALVFFEVFPAPLSADRPGGIALARVPPPPPVYTWLAERPGMFTVLELPFPHQDHLWRNAPYLYWSTLHWQPLVNGYSGFPSPNYGSTYAILQGFPDALSEEALRRRDVRYVVVHWDRYTAGDLPLSVEKLNRTEWLLRRARFQNVDVFELGPTTRLLTRAGLP